MTDTQLLLTMPTDDELYTAFIKAIREGVHENIKGIAGKLSWFIENAKDCIKDIIHLDPETGLSLDITLETGDIILATFVSKQNLFMRNTLKLLLATVGASTFTNFVNKMKKDPSNIETTTNTLSKIMTIFFATLGETYHTTENEESIKTKISNLFA